MRQSEHLAPGHGKRRGSEKYLSQANKWNQQREPQRIDQKIYQLDCGEIQPKNQSGRKAQQSGRAENRKDAEHDSKCEAQGDLFRSDALSKQLQNGGDQPLLEECLHESLVDGR